MTATVRDHIQSLDGLRGFAAFWVFFVHINYANLLHFSYLNGSNNPGAFGVSFFFVLSGFLIGYLYLDRAYTGASAGSYLVSRFSRIAPAYLFIVITAYLITNFLDQNFIYNISTPLVFIRHLLFAGNINALWSISPEVQFYIYFLLIWYAYQHKATSNLWLWVIFITIILMIIGYIPKGTLLSTHVQLFTFGVVAGQLRNRIRIKTDALLVLLQILTLIGTLAYCAYLVKTYNYSKPYHVIDYAALVALSVFSLSFTTIFTQKTFETKVMRYLGRISFSLYLLNPITVQYAERLIETKPNLNYVIVALLVVVTLFLSGLMYHWIELPVQKWIKQTYESFSKPKKSNPVIPTTL